MSFKEVQSLDADVTISLGGFNRKANKENPKSIEGFYLGKKTVSSPKSKSGTCFIHILQTPKGNVGVWGKTDLDRKLMGVTPGVMTRITHTGMQATPSGNDMYKFKVEQDETKTIEVPEFQTASEESESEGFGSEEEQEPAYEEPEDLVAAAAASKANQARVQALLGKKKQA